jgi:hypothetical protein
LEQQRKERWKMKKLTTLHTTTKATAILIAVLGLAFLASVLAAPKGTDRPLKGQLTGEATFAFGVDECVPVNGVGVKTTTVAAGNVSHLGNVEGHFTHCPGPLTGGPTLNGNLTLWAANGDQLWATYEDEDGAPPYVLHFNGGTGRFEHAVGVAELDWGVQWIVGKDGNPDFSVPWPWWATLEGTISY